MTWKNGLGSGTHCSGLEHKCWVNLIIIILTKNNYYVVSQLRVFSLYGDMGDGDGKFKILAFIE